jgi:hypothetical protein
MKARCPRVALPGETLTRGLTRSAWQASPFPSWLESRWSGLARNGQLSFASTMPSWSRSGGGTAVKWNVWLYAIPAEVVRPTRQYQTLPSGGP